MRPLGSCRRHRDSRLVLVGCALALGTTLSISLSLLVGAASTAKDQAQSESTASNSNNGGLISYFTSARQLLSSGLEAHNQAQNYAGLMPNEDPRTAEMLRETIDKTSDLINDYRQDGLSNMPPVPNLPGLSSLMRLPDKLLRAELSMLQDGIRMAQEMRERPITATMNTPRGK